VLALPGTWEEFRRTRPRNVRESLRKCYNSLERDGHAWRFRALDSGADVEAALERFFDLHGRRAERVHSVAHLDYFAAPQARRFLSGLVGRLGRCGAARMFQLEVSGEVVAMRLGFRFGTNLYLYYSGYDPAWGRHSVMTTVVAEAIRHAIESGATTVNLSSGADVSKTRWRPREVGYLEGVALGRGIRARLAHRSFRAAWAARRLAMGVRRRAHA
jgi:CelD/BcsL family acetyltransferase involved in cellulose biosynthesis